MTSNRSPRYPVISLGAAIQLAQTLFDKEGRAPMTEEIAVKHLGYKGMNGASTKVLSALRKYGLVDDVKGGVQVSRDAIAIAAYRGEPDHAERRDAIKRAAHRVELFSKLYDEFGLASEQNLAAQLVVRGFSQEGAVRAARTYRETMELAGGAAAPASAEDADADGPAKIADIEVGDLVNVERDGALVFPNAVRVREIRETGGRTWVWTDESDAWSEIETVVLVSKGALVQPPPSPPPFQRADPDVPKKGMQEDRYSTDEGVVRIEFPEKLSAASVEELQDFFELFIRKAKRRAGMSEKARDV